MASRLTRQEEELTCPVCRGIFKHPVVLLCSHSFCKDCLQEWWSGRATPDCPVCKTRSPIKNPPTCLVLKNLCENLLEEKRRSASSVSSEVLCVAHGEKLRLFCLDDEQLACLVCRYSEKHAGHMFLPIDEASGRCKEKVNKLLKPLKDKLEILDKVKTDYDLTEIHIKVQAQNTEMQIKEQFKRLHQFLQEEEEARISALWGEEEQKSREIKGRIEKLNRDMVTLSGAIRAAVDQLRAVDHVWFLQNYKMDRVQLTPQDPQPVSGALIDEAKHLDNLAFRVWNKMKDIVSYTPVTLDPNTAPRRYRLSDDLTSVNYLKYEERLQLPDNPERFDYFDYVLGSEGFNSGSHSWDVEVGDNSNWALGVLAESHPRKGKNKGAYWRIEAFEGKYIAFYSLGAAPFVTDLSVEQKPRRIRVQLDWNRGELSFSDPDSNTHLHIFTHTFTERLFPFVRNYDDDDDMSLKILPGKISVTLYDHMQLECIASNNALLN